YRQRLLVRPGLTGLAQVLQAPDTDMQSVGRKLYYDVHYVHHVGFWLDLRILLATLFHLLQVPAHKIARTFRFPNHAHRLMDEPSLHEGKIPTSSQIHPYYVN